MEIIKSALMCSTAQPAPPMKPPRQPKAPKCGSAHRNRKTKAARQRPQQQHRKQDHDDGGDDGGDDGELDASETPDELVPDPKVAKEFSVSLMTLWRWTHDPNLDFPPTIGIRNRNFRSRRQLEAFKARLLRAAITSRDGKAA
jgi:hypothetical protein